MTAGKSMLGANISESIGLLDEFMIRRLQQTV